MSTLTDEEVAELLARVTALEEEVDEEGNGDGGWTFWDHDTDVAWDVPESRHGRIAEILTDAGWERCYHRDGARFHFNVKLNGHEGYMALRDALMYLNDDARKRVDEIVTSLNEGDLYFWWEDDAPTHIREAMGVEWDKKVPDFYSCGRSSGYFNVAKLETDAAVMVRLAQLLGRDRDYFNGAEYAKELAQRAIEVDNEQQIAALASPRPERIEA